VDTYSDIIGIRISFKDIDKKIEYLPSLISWVCSSKP